MLSTHTVHQPGAFLPAPPAHCSYRPDLCLQYEGFDLHYADVYPTGKPLASLNTHELKSFVFRLLS